MLRHNLIRNIEKGRFNSTGLNWRNYIRIIGFVYLD